MVASAYQRTWQFDTYLCLLETPARTHDAGRAAYDSKKIMKLFLTLKRIREFERAQIPFFKSLITFDIVIEIGYAQEQNCPLTTKQLFLLNLSSDATVRRRLARLIDEGIVKRRPSAEDGRSTVLTVSKPTVKLLDKYAGALSAMVSGI
jgi:hypothetical protein